MSTTTCIIMMAVCLALSAYFSATETAFSCMNKIRMKNRADAGERKAILALSLAEDFDRVLSLNLTTAKVENPAEDTEVDAELEAYILEKIEERKAAKKEKDFAKADAIRDDLLAKGIVLKDTREGVIWHKA